MENFLKHNLSIISKKSQKLYIKTSSKIIFKKYSKNKRPTRGLVTPFVRKRLNVVHIWLLKPQHDRRPKTNYSLNYGIMFIVVKAIDFDRVEVEIAPCTVVCIAKFLKITRQIKVGLTDLNEVKVEVLPSLSLKNGVSRSIVKGPFRGPKWTTSSSQKL